MAIKDLTNYGFYIQTKYISTDPPVFLCGLIDITRTDISKGIVEVVAAANIKKCSAYAEVLNIAACDKWGPTLYLAMIEEFARLRPCSEIGKVSERASKVWKKFEADKLINSESYPGLHAEAHLNKIYSVKNTRLDLHTSKKRIQEIIEVKPQKRFWRKINEQEIIEAKTESDRRENVLLEFVRDKAKKSTEIYMAIS